MSGHERDARDVTDRTGPGVHLPSPEAPHPLLAISRRFALAIAVVVVNWLLVVVERDSYTDNVDGEVSLVDALYYTTVTLSTTGYGDITPVTENARLVNALLVTPMRLLFVVILVGTTIQALTERSREQYRLGRWRRRMQDHVVVVGYGAKGRNAIRALLLKGHRRDGIVVVDSSPTALAEASAAGFVTVSGPATRTETLVQAMVGKARTVVVALGRDDTAVLVTLAVRRLSARATVVAAVREAGNGELLRQSGATSVIVSSETAGRLLGVAADSPDTVDVVEDLLSFGHGLDLVHREVTPSEVGRAPHLLLPPVLAVLRGDRRMYYDDPEAAELRAGDRLVQAVVPRPAP